MPRRASRQELPSISNDMECTCCAGKAMLRKEDFMEKKARLDGILMGEEERRKRFYRRALPESRTLKEALGCLSREEQMMNSEEGVENAAQGIAAGIAEYFQ